MKKYIILIFVLLSVFLIVGATACRHSQRNFIDQFALEAAAKRIAFQLDLDESQKNLFQDIITDISTQMSKLRSERDARCQYMADLVRQDVVDRESMDQIITEKFDGMQAIADLAADRLTAFHASLTPEQREKAAEQIEDISAGFGPFSKFIH